MYFILRKGVLRDLISKALKKAGNIRKLEINVKISRSTLSRYYNEKIAIKKENLDKLLDYLNTSIKKEDIAEELSDNWKQIKGGKRCVEEKKKNGNYQEQLKQCQKKGVKGIRLWHRNMKKNNPKKYYLMQYEKFKKIGGYKFTTENGEKVRNKFEKDTADILKNLKVDYKYEPLIKIGNKGFFPDFLINNNIIIECTEWRGSDKAIKLKNKIEFLKKEYKVFVLIPKPLKRYYETLNHHLLLGMDDLKETIKKFG
ncbi:MAG: helix-turn-helix domain-containing protein [Nanoarchaeota archaeon]|nr:helix-turn-helix domain-containing protein [Nanoarchaeota archaeon]